MPGGRPTKYKKEYAEQAAKLCKLGATDAELADFFGVNTTTIWRWQSAHEEFCNSLKAAKEEADKRVERSLYQKAVGYTFSSEKVFQHQGEIVRAQIVEHVPPSDTAAIFWLKNRDPEAWRDKRVEEHSGKMVLEWAKPSSG
jgi:hypothetical protein